MLVITLLTGSAAAENEIGSAATVIASKVKDVEFQRIKSRLNIIKSQNPPLVRQHFNTTTHKPFWYHFEHVM